MELSQEQLERFWKGRGKPVASELLAWRDGLREVGAFLQAPSTSGAGEAVFFILPTVRVIIIFTEVKGSQATWSRSSQSLS